MRKAVPKDVVLYGSNKNRRFGGTCRLHLQGRGTNGERKSIRRLLKEGFYVLGRVGGLLQQSCHPVDAYHRRLDFAALQFRLALCACTVRFPIRAIPAERRYHKLRVSASHGVGPPSDRPWALSAFIRSVLCLSLLFVLSFCREDSVSICLKIIVFWNVPVCCQVHAASHRRWRWQFPWKHWQLFSNLRDIVF
jgi:hypothetical protein